MQSKNSLQYRIIVRFVQETKYMHVSVLCVKGCEYGDRDNSCAGRPALDCYYPDLVDICCLTCARFMNQNATRGKVES